MANRRRTWLGISGGAMAIAVVALGLTWLAADRGDWALRTSIDPAIRFRSDPHALNAPALLSPQPLAGPRGTTGTVPASGPGSFWEIPQPLRGLQQGSGGGAGAPASGPSGPNKLDLDAFRGFEPPMPNVAPVTLVPVAPTMGALPFRLLTDSPTGSITTAEPGAGTAPLVPKLPTLAPRR